MNEPADLLIECCLAPAGRRREAWRAWRRATDFDALDAESLDLLPAVFHLNRDGDLDDRGRLRGLFRHNWAVQQERLARALPLLGALERHGLDPTPIKGLAVSLTAYGSIGARRSADFDILVREDGFAEAAALAESHGFAPLPGLRWPRAGQKSWAFAHRDGGEVDVHVRPLVEPWNAEAKAAFQAGVARLDVPGLRLRRYSGESELVVALLHGQRYRANGRRRWIIDAALLIRRGIDWALVSRLAAELRVSHAVWSGLRAVARHLEPAERPAWSAASPGRPWERLEHLFRTRAPAGLLGALPNLYFLYRRERAAGLWTAGLGAYLRDVWDVPRERGLSPLIAEKVGRRARETLIPGVRDRRACDR